MRYKKPYRTVDVQRIHPTQFQTKAPEKWVVAVDVAKEKMVGTVNAVTGSQCELCAPFKWTHPAQSELFYQLCQKLAETAPLEVVLEPTGTYGDPLVYHLNQRGVAVFMVRPDLAQKMTLLYDGHPSSHDAKSACILAELHVQGRSRAWEPEDDVRRDLKASVGTLTRYSKRQSAELNQLHALLARGWPDLSATVDIATQGCLTLLADMGGPDAVRAHPTAARQALGRGSSGRLSQEKVEAVLHSAQQAHGRLLTRGETQALQALAADALDTHHKLRATQKALGQTAEGIEAVALLRPVLGRVTAAALVAALGDLRRYPSPATVVRALGLTLKERQSGQKRSRLAISKRGSSQARWYLFMAALRLIQRDPVVRAWHAKKRARDGGTGLRSVVAIMRKLAKALWHIARGQRFDAAKLFDTRLLDIPAAPQGALLEEVLGVAARSMLGVEEVLAS